MPQDATRMTPRAQSEEELMRELADIEKDEQLEQACQAQELLLFGQEFLEERDFQP